MKTNTEKFQAHIGLSCNAFVAVQIIRNGYACATVAIERDGEVSRFEVGKSLHGRERAVYRLARIAAKSSAIAERSARRVEEMRAKLNG